MYTSTNEPMDREKSSTSYSKMIILGIVLVMPNFLSALSNAYPAIALPQMKLDINAASWFASISIFASPLSVIVIGFLIDKLGRKITLLYCIAPSIGGWLLLYTEYSVSLILLGQALNGLTTSTSYYPVQVYAGECIMVDNVLMRNIFMTWISLSASLGATLILIMGNIFSYHEVCLILSVINIIVLVIFFKAIPESPVWLYRQGRIGDAEWSQKRLGITRSKYISMVKTQCQQPIQDRSSYLGKLQKITRPDVYRPTIILSLVYILLSWCGATTVSTYLINVIQNTVPGDSYPSEMLNQTANVLNQTTNELNQTNEFLQTILNAKDELQLSYQLSLYSGLSMCLGSLLSIIVFPRLGLKKMLITSKCCLIVAMLIVFYGTEVNPADHIVIRVIGVTMITFFIGLEIGPRMSFIGDVFPVDAKGFASVPTLAGLLSKAMCYKMFPYFRAALGGYVFCIFAAITFTAIFFIHFFIPEVVGRNLEDINKEYVDSDEK